MTSQSPSSSPPATGKTPSQVLLEQRRGGLTPNSSPVAARKRASSTDILVPSSDDPDSSRGEVAVTSTPYNSKFHHSTHLSPGDDPFRTPQQSDSSPDNSLSTPSTAPNSAASASVELFLGPQPLSYIHLRNRILNGEEYNPSPLRPKNVDSATDVPPLISVASSNSNVIERPPQVTLVPSEKVAPDPNAPQLSKWRQEQLKKVKPIRPVAGARERPIPLLHGPLSLPYARNPSGVDATVADQSSYMSHVFGLRVVNSPESKGASSSTRGSSESNRNPSSSSHVPSNAHNHHHHHNEKSNPFLPSNPKQRPMVVRDYNQVIGIKKDVTQEAPEYNPPKMPAYLAQAVDARTQLGLGKPATSVPSPPDHKCRVQSDSYLPQFPGNQGADKETTTLTLVDPLTQQFYTVKVPKSSVAEPLIDPNSDDKIHTSTPYSGKADSSINWRKKQSRSSQGTPIRSLNSPYSQPHSHGSPASKDSSSSSPQVLTLEHLYEKFANKKVPTKEEMTQFAPPKSSLAKSSTPASVLKALSALNDSTNRKTNVSESENVSSNSNSNRTSPAKKKRPGLNKARNSGSKTESSSPGGSPQKGPAARRPKRTVKTVGA